MESFGGTYESASGDFTRKEFTKLINHIRGVRKKPFAILINKINRFFRTGGGAIGLVTELTHVLGVHLIDTSTGKSTLTPEGEIEINQLLLDARKDNLTKLAHTLPGMVKHLQKGKWVGKVPRGYDHYGPKVKDMKRYSETQTIKINDEGKIFEQAWKWKVQGEKDFAIIKRLSDLGINITKQGLSEMWRNPFYAGVSRSKLLDGDVVDGKWDKIVSHKDFLYVQEILKGNTFGYKHNNSNPWRPLNAFIRCFNCGKKMAGYEVKKKKKHYYKCQDCLGVSINALTTPKTKTGANDLFEKIISII